MPTVIFLSGQSMNDALGALGRAHRPIFESVGCDFVEIDLSRSDAPSRLSETIQRQPIEFAYSAMGMGSDIAAHTPDGTRVNLWEGNGIPYLSLKGDSPAYFFDRHVMRSRWHACLYCHEEHLELRKRLSPVPALYGSIPPFAIDLTDARTIDFAKKERGVLLFLKNGNDPEAMITMWRQALPPSVFMALADLAGELSGRLVSEPACDIDLLVRHYFASKGWDVDAFQNLRLLFVAQLDDYFRRVKSNLVADAIADFPVAIYGYNWDHFDFSKRRARYVKGGDFTASRGLILDALGMIDMAPNTQRTPHDRVLRAFGLSTFCLTNEQAYITDTFPAAAESFTYQFDRDNLQSKIEKALANPRACVEIGRHVAHAFQARHRPEAFGQYMLDTAALVRTANGTKPTGFQDFFVWPPTIA